MPTVEKHKSGSFSWIELGTTDQDAAKKFYGSLFGWSSNDHPMGPSDFYTMFEIDGEPVAAAYTLRPDMRAQGVPPHWMIYVSVDSADGTAQRAAELGGNVIATPFDVFTYGRMAVIQDPTGATFSVWEPKQHIGARITGVPGTLCWADLSTPDVEAASKFYSGLFGWKIDAGESKDMEGYLHIKNGESYIGGMPPAQHRNPNAPPHWLGYVLVSDCEATAAQAKEMGATLHLPPMKMENVGTMAVVADPQGAVFAIFQDKPRA